MSHCPHVGECGGCSLQHLDGLAYARHKKESVIKTLAHAGLDAAALDPEIFITPPRTRRRTVFKAALKNGKLVIGYNQRASHALVDVEDCAVITPRLMSLLKALRDILPPLINNEPVFIHATDLDGVVELVFEGLALTRAQESTLATFGAAHNIGRIMAGDNIILQQAELVTAYGGYQVSLSPKPFLQASDEAQAAMLAFMAPFMAGAKKYADLFCGSGLFALSLYDKARMVYAVDADARAISALQKAGVGLKNFKAERRNLFREPLSALELNGFDTVLLDPPRVGASAQITELTKSMVPKIIYVSCNPQSFAADAAMLVGAGYRLDGLKLFDQFLWSNHCELVGVFDNP